MQSFRTELENPIVEKDIIDLEKKIYLFRKGELHEESFRSLRLARGVYGQRQQGVQMVRIKLPLGIVSPSQLRRLAEISDEYSNGILHITTRQDIQVHHVSLDRTPELWSDLEKDDITIREACGNTVRNITASPFAGIDENEPFDITPVGKELFQYFLRNPIGQELGRKFKIAISSSSKDQARTYMHDLGLIPVVQNNLAGFKILIGGGLGSQPAQANVITEFLPVEDILKFGEALVKVFDKYGERNKRQKARLKFLIKEIGLEEIKKRIGEELLTATAPKLLLDIHLETPNNISAKLKSYSTDFEKWKTTNVFEQKQKGFQAVLVKVRNGNISSIITRRLADIIEYYSGEPARLTIEQNILIRSVAEDLLEELYQELQEIGLTEYGAGTIADITSCPGTSTCNLGITATYNVSEVIEKLLFAEFNELIFEEELVIKISGCMNACGQHSVADIGFHGSSFQSGGVVIPALQVLLGGANLGDGAAQYADKILKIPTKRVESLIRILLNDFKQKKRFGENFNIYYNRLGKIYFYELLKPLSDVTEVKETELLDWGSEEKFKTEIGIGECAGVKIDLVKTLLFEAKEKLDEAEYLFLSQKFPDAAYTIYSAIIQTAKSFLLKQGVETNSKEQIQKTFAPYYPQIAAYFVEDDFDELIANYKSAHADSKQLSEWIETGKRFYKLIEKITDKQN